MELRTPAYDPFDGFGVIGRLTGSRSTRKTEVRGQGSGVRQTRGRAFADFRSGSCPLSPGPRNGGRPMSEAGRRRWWRGAAIAVVAGGAMAGAWFGFIRPATADPNSPRPPSQWQTTRPRGRPPRLRRQSRWCRRRRACRRSRWFPRPRAGGTGRSRATVRSPSRCRRPRNRPRPLDASLLGTARPRRPFRRCAPTDLPAADPHVPVLPAADGSACRPPCSASGEPDLPPLTDTAEPPEIYSLRPVTPDSGLPRGEFREYCQAG